MRSKTSFFNPTLFRKNLTRFWPLWGGASALGALVPLVLLTELLQNGFRSHAGEAMEFTQSYYYVVSYAVPIISLFYAALCALAVWHYLYNPRSVGMYHSLPITRKGLFVTNVLSGMAMMLIPYAVTGLLAILVTIPAGLFEPAGVLVTILAVLGESFFYFAAATLIIFVTGNPFAFAAFYFIFHFLAAGAEMLLSELASLFYYGVQESYQGVIEFLSPTLFLVRKLTAYTEYERIPTAEGWTERGEILSVTLENGWLIAVYAAVGIVLLGCAWLLYQRRRSESAGDVVAVGWMKPVFRYGVALCAAAAGGTLLYDIFCRSFQPASTAMALPMAVCMAIAGVIGYYIASMLLAKALKVFRGSGKGVLSTVIAAAAVCLLIAADPFGLEKWVPDIEDVTDAGIDLYTPYGTNLNINTHDPAVVRKIVELHQAIADEGTSLDRDYYDVNETGSAWKGSVSLNLWYNLGESDKREMRYYYLPYTEAGLERSEAVRMAAALAADPVIQEENIFGELRDEHITAFRLTGGYIGNFYNTQTGKLEAADLTQDQARELEAAIGRDIQAGHFGRTSFLTDYEQYAQTVYFSDLQLSYRASWRWDDGRTDERDQTVSLNFSVWCTETVKALEDVGVLDGTHKLLTEAEWNAMNDREKEGWHYQDGYPYPAEVVYPEDAYVSAEEVF